MGVLSFYMLLGMLFAFVYGAIDRFGLQFFNGAVPATVSNCLYFSFTTLTTVGYGDLTARTNLGHTLATFEALIGQIYLVTVVSLIVSNLGRPSTRQADLVSYGGLVDGLSSPGNPAGHNARIAAGANNFIDLLPLALWSAFYPTLLTIVVLIMRRPDPRRMLLTYYAGGMVVSLTAGFLVIAAFDGGRSVGASDSTSVPVSTS